MMCIYIYACIYIYIYIYINIYIPKACLELLTLQSIIQSTQLMKAGQNI